MYTSHYKNTTVENWGYEVIALTDQGQLFKFVWLTRALTNQKIYSTISLEYYYGCHNAQIAAFNILAIIWKE